MGKRLFFVVVICCLASPELPAQRRRAVSPPNDDPAPTQFGETLPGLPASMLPLFTAGRDEFRERKVAATGLGPVFNGRTCAECHIVPVLGGGSERIVTRVGTMTDGRFDPLAQFGGSLLQNRGIHPLSGSQHEYVGELPPFIATIIVRRRSQPLFGLSLVDATPDATFVALAVGTLGDGIEEGAATGREMRTAPLWGLRVVETLLHDGRVRSIEAAIEAHDGQGRASRDRFGALNETERAHLLAFLRSL